LLQEIKHVFQPRYHVYVIEFQKRGLPHAHIVLKVCSPFPLPFSYQQHQLIYTCFQLNADVELQDIDDLISAQIPDAPGCLRDLVLSHMVHGQDHLTQHYSRCNRDGRCVYNFPFAPNPHTRINQQQRVLYKCRECDAWIAPYIPSLLLLWEGHIHTDAIFTVDIFLYIYKYLFKGPDTATFTFTQADEPADAIEDYIRARYISSCEAAWRIFSYHISHQYPSATRLAVHEEHMNRPQYRQLGATTPASSASTLIHYFNRPTDPIFDDMLYTTFFETFIHMPYPSPPSNYPQEWWPEAAYKGWLLVLSLVRCQYTL
jgi:hypothetical protein